MKIRHIIITCLLLLLGEARAQFWGPMPLYGRVAADTLPDTSLMLLQIPPYSVGGTVYGRSMTVQEFADYVGAEASDSGTISALISDSLAQSLDSGTRDIDVGSVTISNGALNFLTTSIFEGDTDWMGVSALRFTTSGDLRVIGGVGFYGKEPVTVPCELPYATPPNPVTEAEARAEYDLAFQNCLDESGVQIVTTP